MGDPAGFSGTLHPGEAAREVWFRGDRHRESFRYSLVWQVLQECAVTSPECVLNLLLFLVMPVSFLDLRLMLWQGRFPPISARINSLWVEIPAACGSKKSHLRWKPKGKTSRLGSGDRQDKQVSPPPRTRPVSRHLFSLTPRPTPSGCPRSGLFSHQHHFRSQGEASRLLSL